MFEKYLKKFLNKFNFHSAGALRFAKLKKYFLLRNYFSLEKLSSKAVSLCQIIALCGSDGESTKI